MFGTMSMVLAAGAVAITRLLGRTFRVDGAMPNVHVSIAPLTTWRPMAQEYSGPVAVIPFVSQAGDVLAVEPEIEYVDDRRVQVRFMVDDPEWLRIQSSDIFGARSRRRVPDELTGSGPIRVTVEGSRLATESPRGWAADEFEIVSAMRPIDASDRWQGLIFASAPAWGRALEALVEMGFTVDGETEDEVSATNHLGVNAMISVYPTNQVASVVYAVPIDSAAVTDFDILDLVNRLNASFIIGSLSVAFDERRRSFLFAKAATPILDGLDVAAILEALVIGLTGMLIEVSPVVDMVLRKTLTVEQAFQRLS